MLKAKEHVRENLKKHSAIVLSIELLIHGVAIILNEKDAGDASRRRIYIIGRTKRL